MSGDYRYTLYLLRLVAVIALLGYGIYARRKIINLEFAFTVRFYRLIDTVALNSKGDTLNFSVLTGLDDFCAAVIDFDIQIPIKGVADGFGKGYKVLNT